VLAFSTVTLLGELVTGGMAERQLSERFRQFARHSQFMSELGMDGGSPLESLVAHYQARGDWTGVGTVLAATDYGVGHGPGRGGRALLLADADGTVVFDGALAHPRPGSRLTAADLRIALPVVADGRTVGYLTTRSQGWWALSAAAQSYLGDLRAVLVRAGFAALLMGVAVGLLMARVLADPLCRVAAAARGFSRGEPWRPLPETGVDEVSELGRAFNEMVASLARAEELRGHMVADIAHELRTPLTVIQGNLRAMLDGVYSVDGGEIARVYDESRRLGRLVEDLRDLAHAEAGRLSLRRGPVDLDRLLTRAVALFAEQGRERAVRIGLTTAPGLPRVDADEDRVGQVVANLLANALHHARAGGAVAVVAETIAGEVRVHVSDDGPGLGPRERERVFDRFWRAEASRTREGGGSGLGLAIARQIIVAHGGRIGVDSVPGEGSRFWFTLPVAAANAVPAEVRALRP